MLYLIRGLPGAGKSTLAQTLLNQGKTQVHFEADMFFMSPQGHYAYDHSKIDQAHSWCQDQTKKALEKGYSVAVSNTFVRLWEMQFYKNLALNLGVPHTVLECTGQWENIHGVPEHALERMRGRWERDPSAVPAHHTLGFGFTEKQASENMDKEND